MNLSTQKLKLVLEANRIISSTLNTSELLRQVMKLATEVVGAETSSILLYDEKTGELYFDLALGDRETELKQIRLKPGEGIAGWVAVNRKTQVVSDAASDPRRAKQADLKTSFRTRSMIAVPLLYKDRLLGVVEAINKKGGEFSDEDAGILEAFAAQAAVAVENARVFESLQETKEKVEAVFSQMTDGAVFADEKGRKLLMNGAAEKLLGSEVASGETVFELFKGFDPKPALATILSASGKNTSFEFVRKASKALYLSGTATKIMNSDGCAIGSIFIFRDSTAEKKESLVKKNFLALISHKLKTPLVTITGYGPLLLEDASLGDFQRKAVKSIEKQGSYLLSLVEKLLHFTLIDADELEIDICEGSWERIARNAAASLRAYMEEKDAVVTFREELAGLPPVRLDEKMVEAAVRNLLENAVKFNGSKDKKTEIGAVRAGNFAGIYVKDNGPGIPPEERDKVFGKFYQIEETFTGQVEGAGLGLALVKRIAEAHGGKVTLESAIGSGCTFNLLFPCSRS